MDRPEHERPADGFVVRALAHELAERAEGATPEENWWRAERELMVVHDYDTLDRDLERVGMTVSRLPAEAGVVWRLRLPRGEQVDAWEPGNAGLAPPPEIADLIAGVVAGKGLIPAPPLSDDPGASRLRGMIEAQRLALLTHDPGARLGEDPENLHEHRVAARRTRAFLRATRSHVDPVWRRSLTVLLRELGRTTGPVRDLDVLLEHVRGEVGTLAEAERAGAGALVEHLESERAAARRDLVRTLAGDGYRVLLMRLRLPPRLAAGVETVPLEQIARKEFRRLVEAVDGLGKHPDEAALHRLRIILKRARYAAELAAPRGKAGRRFLADAKKLQGLLGEHQDAVVAEERLRATAVTNLETAAAFVAGRLAERRRARREQLVERLPAAWRRLHKSGSGLH